MAEKVPTAIASEALANLKQQLTCPICLDHYTQPRTLPCLHSFCHNCLAHFPVQVQGGKNFMTCPVCRQTTQQPNKGVSGFQPAFIINNLLELHQVLEKVSLSQQNNCENCHKEQSTGYCKQCSVFFCQTCVDKHNELFSSHQILGVEDVATTASKLVLLKKQSTTECSSHGKPLEVYCDTCDKLVCHLCTTAKVHRNHDYKPIADAFPRHQQQIVDSLKQVKKKLGGTDTLDTPLNVVEVMPRRARLTFSGLSPNSYTAGLAITREGHLIVAECSKYCITIIDPTNGKKIRSFGQCGEGQVRFNYPHGVAVTQDGCIVVSDYRNCSLQVLTAEGAFIATVGTKGSKPLQFDRPTGVAVHHNGQTFVSDAGNNRVQVLNADLTYSHCFGSKGAQPGDFNDPRGIAIDGDGMVYVADYNNRVQKFTPEGKLLAVIDSKGEGGSRLNCPDGLCFDANGLLYVVECIGNTVSMFSSKGRFLGCFGDGSSFDFPKFIVSDQTGRLYISDSKRVITYTY